MNQWLAGNGEPPIDLIPNNIIEESNRRIMKWTSEKSGRNT